MAGLEESADGDLSLLVTTREGVVEFGGLPLCRPPPLDFPLPPLPGFLPFLTTGATTVSYYVQIRLEEKKMQQKCLKFVPGAMGVSRR